MVKIYPAVYSFSSLSLGNQYAKPLLYFSTCYESLKLGFYVPFNNKVHIGTSPQHCHL